MKKKSAPKKAAAKVKSIFRIAGEALGTIGHEIAEGKDKLVEITEAAADKFSSVKKSITKSVTKKKVKAAVKKKVTPAKKSAKKVVKKAAKQIKKAAPKKKAAKKVAAKSKK